MSIHFSGRISRSAGVISAISKQLKKLNLKPVTGIVTEFDPFYEKVKETRDFLFYISAPKIVATNPRCIFKTKILCDRSEPKITFRLVSGENVVMKCANLSALNILELYNKHITSLLPPAQPKAEDQKQIKPNKKRKKLKIKPYSKHRGVFL